MANEVEIVVTSVDKSGDGIASAGKHVKGLEQSVGDLGARQKKAAQDSEEYAGGLDRAGEAADTSEARIMGVKDTVEGVAAVMKGPGEDGLGAYLQGWADLASGIANAVVPAMQAMTIANAKAAASSVATKAATLAQAAASKVAAAGQWLLNVALTANPIGIVVMAIAALVTGMVIAYKKSETFRAIVDTAFKGIQKTIGWVVEKVVAGFKLFWAGLERIWGWFKKVTGGADDAAEATEVVTQATKNSTIAYKDAATALDELTDRLLGVEDGQMGLEAAIDDATEALKENGRTLDVGTEKGRNNRKALQDIVRETIGWRQAAEEAGKSVDEQTRITERGRDALIRAAQQMGMTKKEAEKYADSVLRIPKTRTTTATIRTPNLQTVRTNFDVVLRDRVVNVRVVTTGSTRIADNDKYTGGITGAASGGARGSWTMVGEHGPELLNLPFGSMVKSNPDTMRMLGAGSASAGPMILVIDIGGRRLGELLIDPIAREVRALGGVEATFGTR